MRTDSRERVLSLKFSSWRRPSGKFRESRANLSSNPNSYLESDPTGLYYSHPSIRVGWAWTARPMEQAARSVSSGLDSDTLSGRPAGVVVQSFWKIWAINTTLISYLDVRRDASIYRNASR